ncbi:Hypothetical predicted protein [Mytilus galloprovincialis]|uniref:PHD-type domain-containing protein n=1 Tax=Mytilus galloprovincialis TaxID=29158 RepID=A0A8B6GQ67_MYTGA|nr:Hypothetical predicted protein [Mytilus galloprovincialis]
MLLALSGDTELNPGPRTPKWPCGTCEKAVTWSQKAICCDTCNIWYHANCQGMPSLNYKCLDSSNISWHCIQCGMPNFSSSIFDLSSLETSNSFDPLHDQSVGNLNLQPTASSTPKKQVNKRTQCKRETPLKILNINFQSLKNKRQELQEILISTKPDIIIGTETWLNKDILSSEFFPMIDYTGIIGKTDLLSDIKILAMEVYSLQ